MSLAPPEKLQKLRAALHAKAKALPNQRFHALYDKVYRSTYWPMPMPAAKPMAEWRVWMNGRSGTSSGTGWIGGWANFRRS
jgi:hypothetical protein